MAKVSKRELERANLLQKYQVGQAARRLHAAVEAYSEVSSVDAMDVCTRLERISRDLLQPARELAYNDDITARVDLEQAERMVAEAKSAFAAVMDDDVAALLYHDARK